VESNEGSLAYEGWRVVVAAFFGVMVSFGAVVPYTFSLFLVPLHQAFGWRREAISLGFGITAMTIAVCSPFIGHLLDRFPPRKVILPAIFLFSAGLGSLALLGTHIAQFYLSYVIMGIVGNATAQLAYTRAVSTWFIGRRGLAIAFTVAGTGVGSIVLPLFTQHMIDAFGWRTAYLALGLTALLVGFPLTALFVRERPSGVRAANHASEGGMSMSQALQSRVFWTLMPAILLYALSANGAIAHLSAILSGAGVTAANAAIALSILGASGIVGRLGTGYLLDRLFAPLVSMGMLLLCFSGLVLLAYTHSAAAGILSAALLGLGLGSEADIAPYLIVRYCGLKRFSTVYGLSWTFYAFGAAIGPVVTGRAFDHAGAYRSSFIVLLSLPCLTGAFLMLLLPKYSPKAPKASIVQEASNPAI
jgi:MFS family permease